MQSMAVICSETCAGATDKSQNCDERCGARGDLVRALHEVGFEHADLQPANILLARGVAFALDLDRSCFRGTGPLGDERANANIGRLWRHVARREREYGPILTDVDLAVFLRAYGIARDAIPARMAAIDEQSRNGAGLHRLGWWLERVSGGRRDARAALN